MSLGDLVHRNRVAFLGLTLLAAGAGLWAAATMPVTIFPEVTFHRISVIARAGDLPVEQTLSGLTRPLENALAGILGMTKIRSLTTRGGAQLDLTFGWHDDMPLALQRVQASMEEARNDLPGGTQMEARLLDTSAFPIVGVAVSAPQQSLAQLSDFAIYEAAPELRTIPGVYRVELNGAKQREYALTVDPARLVQHHLGLADVEAAVRHANVIAGGGLVRDGYHLALAVIHGQGTAPEGLLHVVVAEDHGTPVRLADVARIEPSLREDFTRAAANGATAVLIGVSRQPSGNTVRISNRIRQQVAQWTRSHPQYRFSLFYDQADLVRRAIGSVRDSIVFGMLLAVATIFFFIARVRTTLVAAAVVPAAVLITCAVLRVLGMSFNLMTLGGIAAGIGLILDDAIVVVENFHRHRLLGEPAAAALPASLNEITRALLGSTLTPIAVLLPLGMLGGVPGAFFRPLAVTMSVALLASLVLALSFTPALAATLESQPTRATRPGMGDRLVHGLGAVYARGLRWTLAHSRVAALAGVGFAAFAVIAYRHVGSGFVPEMDEGAFVLDYWSPPGTALPETLRMLDRVDAILRRTPEVASFARRTGAEMGFFLTEANRGDYSVRLRAQRRRGIEDIIGSVREAIHTRVPGLRVEFVQMLQDMIGDLSGNPEPVEIKILGSDQALLEQTARAATALITPVPGLVDTYAGITAVGPTYQIDVDEQRANFLGLTAEAVQQWVDTAVTGTVVGQVLEGDRTVPLRVRYPDAYREQLDRLEDVTLVTPQGQPAPLRSIAHLAPGPLAVQRSRENLRQLVRVTGRLQGRDLGAVTLDVRKRLQRDLALPPGVSLEYGGLYASQREAFTELLLVFAGAVACVMALQLVEFGSVAAAVAIVVGSALALWGSLVGLWLTGTALNVSSIVGMIMVVGIVAKNGILLLDRAGREYADSGDLETALVRAGTVRLRPILMTTVAAVAGLAPLAFGIGPGAQMQQPLAIAIVGGVSLSMLFSLIGVPVLFFWLARQQPATE